MINLCFDEVKSGLLVLYRELYKLKLEISVLSDMLSEAEDREAKGHEDISLEVLKFINSYSYERQYIYFKKLDSLLALIADLNMRFFRIDFDIYNNKYILIEGFLKNIGGLTKRVR